MRFSFGGQLVKPLLVLTLVPAMGLFSFASSVIAAGNDSSAQVKNVEDLLVGDTLTFHGSGEFNPGTISDTDYHIIFNRYLYHVPMTWNGIEMHLMHNSSQTCVIQAPFEDGDRPYGSNQHGSPPYWASDRTFKIIAKEDIMISMPSFRALTGDGRGPSYLYTIQSEDGKSTMTMECDMNADLAVLTKNGIDFHLDGRSEPANTAVPAESSAVISARVNQKVSSTGRAPSLAPSSEDTAAR